MEPRPYAFHKMEALVRQMQDPESGVHVGSQKIFLTSVPSAFVGYDLIEWLMEHLNIDDSVEAVHLANQLCQYGYIIPVDSKNLTFRDDNSLYRFQAAYHWPWHHRNPDNVEYAVYLVKRTLRNKQRHALEEYENEALNSLKKNLQNKWELVTMQAEEQADDSNLVSKNSGSSIKVGKERKKMDKMVADSQERAYWRVHRPPPGCTPPLEPSPLINLRKTINPSHPNTELEIFRRQVSRSRVKVSQAVEGLISYSNTYMEYDPFFTTPQPSNPWLNDDQTFWQFNQPLTETPTEKRIKRWALSFEDLLADPTGVEEFTSYLRKEYSVENIRFWIAVKELRHCSQSQVEGKVNEIHVEFLAHGAPCEINIDSKTQEATLNEMKTPSRFMFDAAAHHVYSVLLNKDCYPRFVRSEQYKNLLTKAHQNPPTKKRFFGFGGVKKKACVGPVAMSSVNKRRGSDRSLTGVVHEAQPLSLHTHIPLSTSQSNLHDISISRDCGVSPERLNLAMPLKQKSFERSYERKSTEDEKNLKEAAKPEPAKLEPPPEPGPSSISKNEPPETVTAEKIEKLVEQISDCGLQEKNEASAITPTKESQDLKKIESIEKTDSDKINDDNKEACKSQAEEDKDSTGSTKTRVDICPWEDEENCKTEEPFVKKYATLGYL